MGVGTDQGKAFIYDRSNLALGQGAVVGAYEKIAAEQAARKKSAAPKSDKDGKGEIASDFWFRHNKEMQDQVDQLFNMSADIEKAGTNPFGGNDPASQEFQKRVAKMEAASKYSQQLKEQWGDFQKAVAGQNENKKYTQESINAIEEYYSKPLEELMSGNVEPPKLVLEGSDFHILQYDTDLSKGLAASGKKEFNDQDVWNFASQSLQDEKVMEAISSQLSQMPEESYDLLKNMSSNAGVSPEVYIRYNQLRPHLLSGKENFDFEDVESKMDIPYRSYSVESGDVTKSGKGIDKNKARALAELMVRSDTAYVQAGIKSGRFNQFGGGPTASFEDNVKAAIEFNYQRMVSSAESRYGLAEDEESMYGGSSRTDYQESRQRWLEDMRSGNAARMQNAAGYITGVKLEDGSRVDLAKAVGANQATDASDGQAVVELRGVRAVKSDGSPAFGNIPSGQMFNQQRTRQMFPNAMSDEELLRYYDESFDKVHDRQIYGKDRTVPLPSRTASTYSGGKPPAPTPQVTSKSFFENLTGK